MEFNIHLGAIYKITCILTGKSYIGQAVLYKFKNEIPYKYGPKGRWSDHISAAMTNTKSTLFYQDIRVYGPNNFELNIINISPLCYMNELETHYISTENTLEPNGYNIFSVGSNPHRTCPRTELRYNSQIPMTDEVIEYCNQLKNLMQEEINDKYSVALKELKNTNIVKVRVATAKNVSAKRSSGESYGYNTITVYVYTDKMKYAKEAKKFRFGGVTIPLEESYINAILFAQRIPLIKNGKFQDQVHQLINTVENR